MRRDLEAVIDEPSDIDEGETADRVAGRWAARSVTGRRRKRLLQQQILTELIEVRQLHPDQVVHEARVEAGLELRAALEPEVWVSWIERHRSRGRTAGVEIRQRLQRGERSTRLRDAAR